jgi:hypothetical protein
MDSLLGIIGGSSLLHSEIFSNLQKKTINTEYGDCVLYFGEGFVFCQRHQASPSIEYVCRFSSYFLILATRFLVVIHMEIVSKRGTCKLSISLHLFDNTICKDCSWILLFLEIKC